MYTQTKDYPTYRAGAWTESESDARMEARSPATGEPIGTVPEGTHDDVRHAIAAGGGAWRGWAGLSAFERADAMERIARIIKERRDELARTLTLDQGKPLRSGANDNVDDCEMRSMLIPLTSILLPEGGMPMNSP
jgi:acyl-CoA reductase-like NAD-dependent aldehyde dehydrogenase